MLYCPGCGKKNGYPRGVARSLGACELCGKKAACFDVDSAVLRSKDSCFNLDLAYQIETLAREACQRDNKTPAHAISAMVLAASHTAVIGNMIDVFIGSTENMLKTFKAPPKGGVAAGADIREDLGKIGTTALVTSADQVGSPAVPSSQDATGLILAVLDAAWLLRCGRWDLPGAQSDLSSAFRNAGVRSRLDLGKLVAADRRAPPSPQVTREGESRMEAEKLRPDDPPT